MNGNEHETATETIARLNEIIDELRPRLVRADQDVTTGIRTISQLRADVANLQIDLSRLRAMGDAIVDALPRCEEHPDQPATRGRRAGGYRYCDECSGNVPEYPHAALVRAWQEARAKR